MLSKIGFNRWRDLTCKSYGHEVDIKRQEDFGYWSEVYSSSVVKIIDFLKTITDLRDYSDEELEDYYVRAI